MEPSGSGSAGGVGSGGVGAGGSGPEVGDSIGCEVVVLGAPIGVEVELELVLVVIVVDSRHRVI
ncbi:hypothetical protein TWF694_000221 [Orbilia ellipsospora]|uniref:Uncharacterized protein n=1 Tax=Orbilia ellipsospora TaxID=2528407 RepID=A0AAV9XMY4_9PEZI